MSTSRSREERAHSIRTVLVASGASAIAAVVTSFFWRSGTPIAAAVTPVIVAVLSELLYHPTAKITQRVTSEGFALSRTRGSAKQEEKRSEARLEQLGKTGTSEPPEPATGPLPPQSDPSQPTLYQSQGRRERGKIHLRFVIVTALIAFAAAAAIVTVPELLGGGSIASHGDKTTLFGGGGGSRDGGKATDPPRDQEDSTNPVDGGTQPPSDGSDEGKGTTSPKPAPKPQQQQSTQPTQTDTGSTSTTPR